MKIYREDREDGREGVQLLFLRTGEFFPHLAVGGFHVSGEQIGIHQRGILHLFS